MKQKMNCDELVDDVTDEDFTENVDTIYGNEHITTVEDVIKDRIHPKTFWLY